MLREAGLSELVKRGIQKDQCVFVAHKRGNDELAPTENLLQDFMQRKKDLERKFGKGSTEAHNQAFLDCDYENRFRNQIMENPEALKKLAAISQRAQESDVFLVCYEGPAKACHRRTLLRIAEETFGTQVLIEGGRTQKRS